MTDAARLAALSAFAGELRSPWADFGVWDAKGFRRSGLADRFVQHCVDDGWVLPDFDWPAWMQTGEAQALRAPDAIMATASADQLAMLLTIAIRQDRFVEGGLNSWFENGLLAAICVRAGALTA